MSTVTQHHALSAQSLELEFQGLAMLPDVLFDQVVTLPQGELEERVEGLLGWREALLEGKLPDVGLPWPAPHLARSIRQAIETLGLARFAREDESLTDAILEGILKAALEGKRTYEKSLDSHLAILRAQREAKRVKQGPQKRRKKQKPEKAQRDEVLMREASACAEIEANQSISAIFHEDWEELVRIWAEVEEIFGELKGLLGLGWDPSGGVLRSCGWLELTKLRALLEQLPVLSSLIQTLGRLQENQEQSSASTSDQIFDKITRLGEEQYKERTPLIPTETRGIERSASIARMLPSEASLLTHPTLRRLWHIRRAERALLGYRLEGTELLMFQKEREDEGPHEMPKLEKGPIIVCLDTSGSMHGTPEEVAKALTLEAMRVAHKEERRCYLYAFSGPEDIEEHELSLAPEGIARLLHFLSQSFWGGTDIAAPMRSAMAKLKESSWNRADILLVSDGEFPLEEEIVRMVREAKKEAGAKLHGVLIGSYSHSMKKLADELHHFKDWESMLPQKS